MPQYNAAALVYTLHILRTFYEYGIYDDIVSCIEELDENDYCELEMSALEYIAPEYERDEIPMDFDEIPMSAEDMADEDIYADCSHWHTVYRFSGPEMREYYRLCRLYEYREGIAPQENPYVSGAEAHYISLLRHTSSGFAADFDSDSTTTKLIFETCQDSSYESMELVTTVGEMMKYYKEHLPEITRDIMCGPPVFLPAPKEMVTT